MQRLLLLGLVGLAAQIVDGALGMGYGVTSTSLLLLVGLSPALASASVHLAEMGTNIDLPADGAGGVSAGGVARIIDEPKVERATSRRKTETATRRR